MKYWEEVLNGLRKHFGLVTIRGKADIIVSGWIESDAPMPKHSKIRAGGTTYLVSSYFNNDATVNVVDKISRMVEQDAENISEG